jgi:ParB-like chromosome segregation protein Spo0J
MTRQTITKKQLQNVPIDALKPYKTNPRRNDGKPVEGVAQSLTEFTYLKTSVIVDEEMILLAGHTTLKAALSLGWTVIPDVTQVFGLTKSQKRAYRIADNKTGEAADWDPGLLLKEINALREDDYDISQTGFSDAELDAVIDAGDDASDNGDTDSTTLKDTFEVIVECKTEAEQHQTYDALMQDGYTCRVLTL